jgi:uncharacterized protein (DUF302 family)
MLRGIDRLESIELIVPSPARVGETYEAHGNFCYRFAGLGLKEKSMSVNAENEIVTLPSRHSVDETVEKLENALRAKGVKLFVLIDHGSEAESAGMRMRPTKLLVFGNPKAGTPLMIAAPSIAIDLPLKILVSEDPDGKVWISYNSPAYLQKRHSLPHELVQNIAVVEALAAKAAE